MMNMPANRVQLTCVPRVAQKMTAGWKSKALVLFVAMHTCGLAQAALQTLAASPVLATRSVLGDYQNLAYTTLPAAGTGVVPLATAFFSGNVCNAGLVNCPNSGAVYLQRSAFGQAIARDLPFPGFVQSSITQVLDLLYNPVSGALRYKDLIYASTPAGVINQINAATAAWPNLYTAGDRAILVEAEKTLRNALKYAPTNKQLQRTLLDLYYDRTVAEVMSAKESFAKAASVRIETTPRVGQTVVNPEINTYMAAIAGYEFALSGYFELLQDTLGINTAMIDSSVTSGMPFGYYIFRQEVPARALNAARYLGADGQLHDVVSGLATPTELFHGYKDLVMLFDLLADSAEAVTEQTRLYSMRGNFMSDHNAMLNLVKTSQEKFYLDGNILLGIFPESSLPGLADPSGLQQSVQR